jgi:hypothetical protein
MAEAEGLRLWAMPSWFAPTQEARGRSSDDHQLIALGAKWSQLRSRVVRNDLVAQLLEPRSGALGARGRALRR